MDLTWSGPKTDHSQGVSCFGKVTTLTNPRSALELANNCNSRGDQFSNRPLELLALAINQHFKMKKEETAILPLP